MTEAQVSTYDEWLKVDAELFNAYVRRFGIVCSFTIPDLTAEQFNELFRTALETGVEVDYEAAGWDPPPPPDILL